MINDMDGDEKPMSLQRAELMKWTLPDLVLQDTQSKFQKTIIRVEETRRMSATVEFKLPGDKWYRRVYYHLTEEDAVVATLSEETAEGSEWIRERYPDLWGLLKHRAAESILALRNGHKHSTKVKVAEKRRAKSTELTRETDIPF